MNRVFTTRTMIAIVALTIVASVSALAQGQLEIVGGDTYDWGTVAPGKLQTVITVKNVGEQDLKINEVRPGCGCTVAPIDKNLLPPGEVGKISITLDVTTRSGPVEKTVTITSTDTARPTRVLSLKANVRRAITCTPAQYMLVNDGRQGVESPSSPMTIRNTGDAPVTIFPPEVVPGGNIKVRFDLKEKKELKPGEELELKAYVTPNEASSLYGTLKVKTSSTELPVIDVTVSGTMAQQTNPSSQSSSSSATQAPK